MSQPGGKKGPSKGPKNTDKDKDESKDTKTDKTPSKDKDETGSNGDKDEPGSPPKPQSAGASVRDAAQRLLVLCQKGEWSPVEQVLKSLEKAIAAAGEDGNPSPLAGVLDPVRISHTYFMQYSNATFYTYSIRELNGSLTINILIFYKPSDQFFISLNYFLAD